MNFSTNQVIQLYVLDGSAPTKVTLPDGSIQYVITHADGKVETTDVFKALVGTPGLVEAANDKKALKELTVLVKSAKVVAGQEYIVALTFRGYSNEDTYHKVFAAKAKTTTLADLQVDLCLSAWAQRGVEEDPLYDLYYGTTKITSKSQITSANVGAGFKIVEAVPYWKLGSFPETLANIEVGTSPIWISGTEDNGWLTYTQFAAGSTTIPNTHKIADLEYFAKGERGNSNAFQGWPDNIQPDLYIDATDTDGYAVLAVHYAFVGANDEVQKSERDAIFVCKVANQASGSGYLTTINTALGALPVIA